MSKLRAPRTSTTVQNACETQSTIRKGTGAKRTGAIPKDKTSLVGKKGKKQEEWALPPFSVAPKKPKPKINWEKVKKDMMRRSAPEGEDSKEIKRICKEVKELNLPVHEFINMISPYTADNGACLRSVMAEDLETFRKLARKVYETMTQDVSDVLVNEQLQMVQYYEEKTAQLTDKMMIAINEIYEMAPEFNFEKYLAQRGEYLRKLLPIPGKVELRDTDALDMQKRMEAYHRLQWLKSEGGRMAEENRRLQARLQELKLEQQHEQNLAAEMVAQAETKRMNLTEEEAHIKEKLDQLNDTVEKQFIASEAGMRKEHEQITKAQGQPAAAAEGGGAIKKKKSTTGIKKKAKRPEWSSTTAAEIEDQAMKESIAAEVNKDPTTSRTSFRRKRTPQEPPPQQTSPFHYSPPKTPPGGGPMNESSMMEEASAVKSTRPPSLFKGAQPGEPGHRPQETRIDEVSTTVHQRRGRNQAPKDTWGGFY